MVPASTSGLEPVESFDERPCLVRGQEPGALEAADVGDGATQVVEGQLGIDLDGPTELGRERIGRLAEAPAPGFHDGRVSRPRPSPRRP